MRNLFHCLNKKRNYLKVLTSLIVFLFLAGCFCGASVQIKDDLPKGTPKGYIEFYQSNCGHYERAGKARVDIIQYGKRKHIDLIGWKGALDSRKLGKSLRIAKIPGEYDFIIWLGTASEKVHVNAVEGMITLVRIDTKIFWTEYGYRNYTKYFDMKVTVAETLIPVRIGANNLGYLVSALNDENWVVRAYAVEALGKMGKRVNEVVIDRLTELSGSDPEGCVREVAKEALEKIRVELKR